MSQQAPTRAEVAALVAELRHEEARLRQHGALPNGVDDTLAEKNAREQSRVRARQLADTMKRALAALESLDAARAQKPTFTERDVEAAAEALFYHDDEYGQDFTWDEVGDSIHEIYRAESKPALRAVGRIEGEDE